MTSNLQVQDLLDQAPATESFREAVLRGFQNEQKQVPSKFLYDERGSELFSKICEQEEYYPTRTEIGIMQRHGAAMAEAIGPRVRLVEYGSGSSRKTRLLLDRLTDVAAYVPVDISREYLLESAEALADEYPSVPVQPVCADYTAPFTLPDPLPSTARTVVYYPGSTIGNFLPEEAREFLRRIADTVGPEGGLLLGVDLQKDIDILEAAYNDAAGVTAAFNKNLLRRMNRELEATFDLDRFEHEAVWNPERTCIEMHLRSTTAQSVTVANETFSFEDGETIHTEDSHKYTLASFAQLAKEAGFEVEAVWTDEREFFSVQYCTTQQ